MKHPDETGIAGAILHRARAKRPARRLTLTASEVGAGPIRFNVSLARAYGWTEEEIAEMAAHMIFIERDHADRCAARFPAQFAFVDGRRVFTGELPNDGPCCHVKEPCENCNGECLRRPMEYCKKCGQPMA